MPTVPKPNPKRTNASVGIRILPRAGRAGPPPKWPLPGRLRAGELDMWRRLWAKPQAVMWEEQGCVEMVAAYCRALVASLADSPPSWAVSQEQSLRKALVLTPHEMRINLWVIGDPEKPADEQVRPAEVRRLRAVE